MIEDLGHSFRCVIADDDHPVCGVRNPAGLARLHRVDAATPMAGEGTGGLALTGVDAEIAAEALGIVALSGAT